uniref:DnaJ homolog subfamily C member 17 n=1 Tax=Theropithecus gelada TaxID=9565 RepID=A0A8D2K8B7_THEGE
MAVTKELLQMDLYALLGIEQTATDKEVKKAYRQKALSYHPDKNPDNPRAAELFPQLSRALEVLTDATARATYDKVRKARKQAAERTQKLKQKEETPARRGLPAAGGTAEAVAGADPPGTCPEVERKGREHQRQRNPQTEAQMEVQDGGCVKRRLLPRCPSAAFAEVR